MTADRDRLASLLHAPCEARWAIAATRDPDRALTLHGLDAHYADADVLIAGGVTFRTTADDDLHRLVADLHDKADMGEDGPGGMPFAKGIRFAANTLAAALGTREHPALLRDRQG